MGDTAETSSLALNHLCRASISRPEDGHPKTVAKITRDAYRSIPQIQFWPERDGYLLARSRWNKAVDLVKSIFSNWSNPIQPDQPELGPYWIIQIGQEENSHPGKIRKSHVRGGLDCTAQKITGLCPFHLEKQHPGTIRMYGADPRRCDPGSTGLGDDDRRPIDLTPCIMEVSAGVNPVNVEKPIALVKKRSALVTEPVLVERLKTARQTISQSFSLSMVLNAAWHQPWSAWNVGSQLGVGLLLGYAGLVNAVTPEQILENTQKYLLPN